METLNDVVNLAIDNYVNTPLSAQGFTWDAGPAVVASLAFSLAGLAVENEAALFVILVVSLIVQFVVFEIVRSAGVVYLDRLDRLDTIPSAESLDQAQERSRDRVQHRHAVQVTPLTRVLDQDRKSAHDLGPLSQELE